LLLLIVIDNGPSGGQDAFGRVELGAVHAILLMRESLTVLKFLVESNEDWHDAAWI